MYLPRNRAGEELLLVNRAPNRHVPPLEIRMGHVI